MNRTMICCAVVIALVGCSPTPTAPEGEDADRVTETSPIPSPESKPFGIGDVETGLRVEARLDAESKMGNVKYEEIETMRKDLARVSVRVGAPYPEELWVAVNVRATINFSGHAVVVKTRVFVEKEEVESFQFVYGPHPRREPNGVRVNVLSGLDAVPSSLLVHAESEAMLFKNTDPATLDAETAQASPEMTVTVHSNPVRIDFGS